MSVSWRGVFPAVCTQFNPDYSLNVPATLAHIDAMLAAGVHGLVMMGSVGENTTLEPHEKQELLKATVAHVRERVPVLTGVAEYTTAGACRWAADAAKLGADGLMVLPPMVYKSDGRETVAHFDQRFQNVLLHQIPLRRLVVAFELGAGGPRAVAHLGELVTQIRFIHHLLHVAQPLGPVADPPRSRRP